MRDMMMESSLEDASCPKDFVGADHGVWRMEALRASNTPCEEKCRPGDVVARLSAMSVALPPTDGFECFPAAYSGVDRGIVQRRVDRVSRADIAVAG